MAIMASSMGYADMTDKQKYRTRLAAGEGKRSTPIRVQRKSSDTPRGYASTPSSTPTGSSSAKQRKYERKSKRFIWPEDLHRLFVAAIFDVGLKNASPKALLSIMLGSGATADLTTEHLKSHLQKYRLNYERSRLEFLELYDESTRRNLKRRRRDGHGSDPSTVVAFPISTSRSPRSDMTSESENDSGVEDEAMQQDSPRPETPVPQAPAPVATKQQRPTPTDYPTSRVTTVASKQAKSPHRKLAPQSALPEQIRTPVPSSTPASLPISVSADMTPKMDTTLATMADTALSDPMLAAAAAAALRYNVPLNAGNTGGLSTLNDPQWNILTSLMSPQLVGMPPMTSNAQAIPTNSTTEPAVAPSDPLGGLSTEPSELQMQIHLAMQAHMNLHRQMLTRKVEVSRVSTQNSAAGTPNQPNVSQNWGDASMMKAASASSDTLAPAALYQSVPTDTKLMLLSARTSGAPTGGTNNDVMNGLGSTSSSNSSMTTSTSAATSASLPAPVTGESTATAALLGMQGELLDAVLPSALEGDVLDLDRWERMDFDMDLDDEDLFSFLKA